MKEFKKVLLPFAVAAAIRPRLGEGDGGGSGGGEGSGGGSGSGEGAGGGGGGEAKQFTQAELDAAVAAATGPLTQKRDALMDELKPLRDRLGKLGDADVESLLALRDKVESDEYLKLITEGKHDEAFDKRFEKERLGLTTEIDSLKEKLAAAEEVAATGKAQIETLVIDGGLQEAYLKAGGFPEAVSDAVFRGRGIFKLGDDNTPEARDKDGNLIAGEKGPLTPTEWAIKLKTEAPHLFPPSAGGGHRGGGGGGAPAGDIDAQRVAAANSGDLDTLRKLRADQRRKK